MRKTIEYKFQNADGPVTVTLVQLGGLKANQVLIRIAKLLGGGLAGAKGGLDSVVATLAGSLDEKTFEQLLLDFCDGGTVEFIVDGKVRVQALTKTELDFALTGAAADTFGILASAIVLNFGNFSQALERAGAVLKTRALR